MSSDKEWWRSYGYYGGGYYSSGGHSRKDEDDDDWDYGSGFGRRSRYRSSLGWGSGKLLDTTTSYSSSGWYSGERVDPDESEKANVLISKAYRATRDMIVILDFPYNIDILFSTDSSITKPGNRRVFIPTTVLNRSDYDDQEKINVFCGLGIHEAAHLKYTTYSVLFSFENKVRGCAIVDAGGSEIKATPETSEFILSLINIVEDERVEDCLLNERPGYSEFIDKAKFWNYKQFIEEKKTTSGEADKFLNNLFRLIRFPENIEETVLDKYSKSYERIKNILTPLPTSTKESCIAGFKVFKEIVTIFGELGFKEKPGIAMKRFSEKSKKAYYRVLYGSDRDSGMNVSSDCIADIIKKDKMVAKLVTGMAEKGSEKKSFFVKAAGTQTKYQESAERIKKYIPGIKKLINGVDKNYTFNIHGCRSGLLDTTKLAEAYQGVPQVYIRQGKVTTSKTTVCVLVDESGSMDCRNKSGLARDAAILLNESFKSMPGVDLYIYGHTADTTFIGSTDLIIYREGRNYAPKYALSEIRARRENRDGVAISEVAKRVRKFTQSNVLMFVISDGSPCAHEYWGLSAEIDVRDRVKKIENDGFSVVQVTIDNVGGADNMFSKIIDLRRDLSELPKKLSQVIKKAVVKDKKTTVS